MQSSFKKNLSAYLISVVFTFFFVAVFVFGATTINDNIATGGTLTVDGLSTLAGFISTASSTAVGAFNVSGLATLSGGVVVNNSTSTITNLVMINATSTNATTTTLDVSNVASTSKLVVGGNGTTISGMIFGYCTIGNTTVNASSTAYADCTGATGVRSGDRVFLMATSSLAYNFSIQAASSTATAGTIQVAVYNTGSAGGASSQTNVNSFNFWALR